MLVQTLKGFRDFLPGIARKRQYVINTLKDVFESYGFEPLETPSLEYEEILSGKYGQEGDKLMYRFKDNGGRNVAMRYDQTVPLARVVAQYQNELPLPFKRYQIQPVWRAENTQRGRYREFIQSDIDTVGTTSLLADAEIIDCVLTCVLALGFNDVMLFINDRKNFTGVDPKFINSIDKIEKIGRQGVIEELEKKGLTKKEAQELLHSIESKDISEDTKKIFDYLKPMLTKGLTIEYKPTLARGLDYYTGSIFEIVTTGSGGLSIGGGGRYDNLIGMFAGKQIPAVGFAFGFDRIIEAMDEQNLFPQELFTTQILVTVFSPELLDASIEACYKLRAEGIATELYLDPSTKVEKQLKYADQKGIPFVIVIGPEEVQKNKVMLKTLQTRTQEEVTLDKIPQLVNKATS